MKKTIFALIIGVVAVMLASSVLAQINSREMQNLDKTAKFLDWLRTTTKDMGQQLNKARREQNIKAISCLESRYADLQRLIAETEGKYSELRAQVLSKKLSKAGETYRSIVRIQKVAQQLVKLANDCLKHSGEPGTFTEALEEFTGDMFGLDEGEEDITSPPPREGFPQPLPPVYQEENVSASSQEQ